MKQVFICCIFAVAAIQAVYTKGIQAPLSGSKNCQLTVRFAVNPVSIKYHRLEILNTHRGDPRYSLRGCHVVSVKLLTGLSRRTSMFDGNLLRFITKQDDNIILKLTLPHHELVHLDNIVEIVTELDCKGKRCVLSSIDDSKDTPQWHVFKRKLLGLKSDIKVDPKKSSLPFFSVFFAVAVILALIITLALCSCGRNSDTEKTLSDEVGGTDLDPPVIGVSRTQKDDEENNASELLQNENTERRNTASSQRSGAFVSKDNEGVNETTRTASQSSHEGDLTSNIATHLESTSSHSSTKVIQASSSHGSIDQIESETLLKTTNPDNSEQVGNKEKVRSASTKEHLSSNSNSKDSSSRSQSDALVYRGNEAHIATSKKNHSVQLISRKHSDKKDSKDTDGREDHKGKLNWLRRKSSNKKSNVENQVCTDNKRKSPSPGRHSTVPLPPTPDTKEPPSCLEEDNQYEAVEPRQRNAAPLPTIDNNYDSVDLKRNSTTAQNSRPASDLYECINDNESKLMRNSLENPEYDIVETKPKPAQVTSNSSNLEYAYTVVAARDNLVIPQETSGSSGLYEVVTDDIKKLSGVPSTQVSIDDTYAVVHKDPSKPKQQTRPLSDTDLAPAPPPVSSLRNVAVSSVKKRAHSEGEDLNIISDEEPSTSTHRLEGPKVAVDHMYAKVNKSLKKRNADNQVFVGETVISDGIEDDTPPPIPPSLYAELPIKDEVNFCKQIEITTVF